MPRTNARSPLALGVSLLLLGGFSLMGTISPIYAATITLDSTGCATMGGSWNAGTSTCTLSSSFTVNDGLNIPSGTTLVVGSGTLDLESTTDNSGAILNHGTLTIGWTFTNEVASTVKNFEGANVNGGAFCQQIFNHGTVENNGSFVDGCNEFFNYGTFLNDAKGVWTPGAGLTNSGTITNNGNFDDESLTYNTGLIDNHSNFSFDWEFHNDNGGSLVNEPGAVVSVGPHFCQDIFNNGTMDNFGTFSECGKFWNLQSFTNKAGGSWTPGAGLSNSGTITNQGSLDDNSVTTNTGSIDNSANYTFDWTFSNDASGTVTNEASGTLNTGPFCTSISNSGTVSNLGNLTLRCDFGNSGSLSNSGTITNAVTLTNHGSVDNSGKYNGSGSSVTDNFGSFTNEAAGTFLIGPSATFSNEASGSLVNFANDPFIIQGQINNLGSFTNHGTIDDYGGVNNGIGAFFTNELGANIVIETGGNVFNQGFQDPNTFQIEGGTITNSGTITIDCGGTLFVEVFSFFNGNAAVQSPCTTTSTTGSSSTSTTTSSHGVPEFPSTLGFVVLFALVIPALLALGKRALTRPT